MFTTPHDTPFSHFFVNDNLMSLFLHTHPPTLLFHSVKFSNIHVQNRLWKGPLQKEVVHVGTPMPPSLQTS